MKKSFLASLIGVITLIILVAVSCNRKDVSNFNTVGKKVFTWQSNQSINRSINQNSEYN